MLAQVMKKFLIKLITMFSPKDFVPKFLKSHVVYQFSCASCGAHYIEWNNGQYPSQVISGSTGINVLMYTKILGHLTSLYKKDKGVVFVVLVTRNHHPKDLEKEILFHLILFVKIHSFHFITAFACLI